MSEINLIWITILEKIWFFASFKSTFWWGFSDWEWNEVPSQSAFPQLHSVSSRILYKHIVNIEPHFLRVYIFKNTRQCIENHNINEHLQAVDFKLQKQATFL